MNVLMDLSDRSGAQAIGNSFVVCLFFSFLSLFISVAKSIFICSSDFSALSHLFALVSLVKVFHSVLSLLSSLE